MDVRARIGDVLNRVARCLARQHALEFLESQKEGANGQLSEADAMDLALEAQRTARRQRRAAKAKPKRSPKK